jgi:hypothetical protein
VLPLLLHHCWLGDTAGADTAAECSDVHLMREGADLRHNDCISRLGSTGAQKVADPDPFRLGLFFAAWSQLDSGLELASSGAPWGSC